MGAAEGVIMPTIMTAHGKDERKLNRLPRRGRRHHEAFSGRDHSEAGHVHAAHLHVGGKADQIGPSKRDQQEEGSGNNGAIAPQDASKAASVMPAQRTIPS
jgi:hypothetical protein